MNQSISLEKITEVNETILPIIQGSDNPINKTVTFENNNINNNNTYIITLVDKSGSMESQGDAPAKRLNEFITDQKGDVTADVWTFSAHDTCKNIICNKPASEVKITQGDMTPDGSTAFWSSVCTVFDSTISRIDKMEIKPNTLIFVLYTDGMENDSRGEYAGNNGRLLTKKKIEYVQTKYNAIVYLLGANICSKDVGGSIGIPPEYCIDYHHSANGCTNVFRSASDAISRLRSTNVYEDRKSMAGFREVERTISMKYKTEDYSQPIKRSCGMRSYSMIN